MLVKSHNNPSFVHQPTSWTQRKHAAVVYTREHLKKRQLVVVLDEMPALRYKWCLFFPALHMRGPHGENYTLLIFKMMLVVGKN